MITLNIGNRKTHHTCDEFRLLTENYVLSLLFNKLQKTAKNRQSKQQDKS